MTKYKNSPKRHEFKTDAQYRKAYNRFYGLRNQSNKRKKELLGEFPKQYYKVQKIMKKEQLVY